MCKTIYIKVLFIYPARIINYPKKTIKLSENLLEYYSLQEGCFNNLKRKKSLARVIVPNQDLQSKYAF